MKKSRTRFARVAVTALAALAVLPTTAAMAAECAPVPTTQLFSLLGDTNEYFVAPGGSFEGQNSWALKGEAKVDDTTLQLLGLVRGHALELDRGASGTSPALCADALRPHLRFAARASNGVGSLSVEAITGNGTVVPLATIDGADHARWSLTGNVALVPPVEVATGDSEDVKIRITAVSGDWKIDTVAIDPYAKR
jgi:hypothetical protein